MNLLKHTIALVVLVATTTFATNGIRMMGLDAKTIGRGGASFGLFDNATLMATNPGGISFLNESVLEGNFSLMVPKLNFTNALNGAAGKTNYFPLPDLAYVRTSGGNFAWGVGAFTAGGMGADFTLNHAIFRDQSGNFIQQEYHSKLAVMQGGVSAAYKFHPKFSIGVSAHLVYSMMEFSMPYSLSPFAMQGVAMPGMTFGQIFAAPPQMGGFGYTEVTAAAKMTGLKAMSFNGKVGFAWNASADVTLGASYSSPVTLNFKSGTAKMDMTAQLNDAFGKAMQGAMMQNPSLTPQQAQAAVMQQFTGMGIDMTAGVAAEYDLEAKLKVPQTVGFGAMFKLADNLRMVADFEWVNWKSAFEKMTLNLSGGTSANINTMMGNTGSFSVDFPMNWEDSYCAKIGFEADVLEPLTVRVGGAFGNNPVPDATVFPVFPAITENHFTLGASYTLSPRFVVHGAYEHAFNLDQKSMTPNLVAQEYNGSISSLSENIFHISFSWLMP